MSTTTTERPKTVELGRYRIPGAERVLVGRRTENGDVEIYDVCAQRTGRTYFVERGFKTFSELAVLVKDYKTEARQHGAVPMSRAAIKSQLVALDRLVMENGR